MGFKLYNIQGDVIMANQDNQGNKNPAGGQNNPYNPNKAPQQGGKPGQPVNPNRQGQGQDQGRQGQGGKMGGTQDNR